MGCPHSVFWLSGMSAKIYYIVLFSSSWQANVSAEVQEWTEHTMKGQQILWEKRAATDPPAQSPWTKLRWEWSSYTTRTSSLIAHRLNTLYAVWLHLRPAFCQPSEGQSGLVLNTSLNSRRQHGGLWWGVENKDCCLVARTTLEAWTYLFMSNADSVSWIFLQYDFS